MLAVYSLWGLLWGLLCLGLCASRLFLAPRLLGWAALACGVHAILLLLPPWPVFAFLLEKTRRLYYRAAYVRCGAPTHTPRFSPRRRDRRKLEARCPIRSKLYTYSETVRIPKREVTTC